MKKRYLAWMLALTVALAGCGQAAEQEKTAAVPETEEKAPDSAADAAKEDAGEQAEGIALDAFAGTELSIAVLREPQDQTKSYNEKPAMKMAEEATGIHINWIELERGTEGEKVNIMLSADMPDAILGLVSESQIASDMELFYDLSEEGLLETYAPKVLSDIEGEEGGIDLIRWQCH